MFPGLWYTENMERKFDTPTVTAIVIGTVLLIITEYYFYGFAPSYVEWAVQICAATIVIIATMYGMVAGILIPAVALTITGAAFMGRDIFDDLVPLMLLGTASGHYMDRLLVRRGDFSGMKILDFCILETALAILAWICIYPLERFYVYATDLRTSLDKGIIYCGVSILGVLCICLPVLFLCNRLFRKKRLIEDARKEYLYDRK